MPYKKTGSYSDARQQMHEQCNKNSREAVRHIAKMRTLMENAQHARMPIEKKQPETKAQN
jgi:hypothetical protein